MILASARVALFLLRFRTSSARCRRGVSLAVPSRPWAFPGKPAFSRPLPEQVAAMGSRSRLPVAVGEILGYNHPERRRIQEHPLVTEFVRREKHDCQGRGNSRR